MNYGDLFTLNPITSVIQIEQADEKSKAHELVSRFVFTPTLGQQFEDLLLPQLQFAPNVERKGLFVVGNYGTGKSHVMGFISVLAEHADLLEAVRDAEWRDKLAVIAGTYCVHRCEISGSTMGLYGIVVHELEKFAIKNGFSFKFKPQDQLVNVKAELGRFQEEFEVHKPGKGVLLVVDELLHYLEGRKDHDLVLDLSVLRSLGEFCEGARFSFMAGLQQKLFENPKFNHVSKEINRVRQRFNDFVIDSKGVAQLIEGYLFVKDASQKEKIRQLLTGSSALYPSLAAHLDEFVALFPAHPRFIDEFQRVSVVERREILTTLTKVAQSRRDQEVSADRPARLITADDYWSYLEKDQGLRTSQDILRVVKNVETLTAKVETGFDPKDDKEAALRLVRALGVNRLTTPEITAPIGLTPQTLVEDLLWYAPIPVVDSEFLVEEAKRLLGRVRDVANGQFLTESKLSGQFFIDPKLDRDYPHEVETRAEAISPTVAQRYLNTVFTRLLEIENIRSIMEGRLWDYELRWHNRNVERPGWLFFGFPSQRSTAKPPKDFYLFFVPSKSVSESEETWSDQPDEIYFRLESLPDDFIKDVKRFAAATDRASLCHPGDEKQAFESIANKLLSALAVRLSENASQWFEVRWNGQQKTLGQWLNDVAPAAKNALSKSKVEALAGYCFEQHFAAKYPNYPRFSTLQTETTRPSSAERAVEVICKSGLKTQAGLAVLDALELYDEDVPTPDRSPWLQGVKDRIDALEPGQVLNHSDLFEKRDDRLMMKNGSLEAEWLHVVLAAGVEAGFWTVTGPQNTQYDATKLIEFWANIKAEPTRIMGVVRPQGVDITRWRQLFDLLSLNKGLLANANTHAQAISDFQARLGAKVVELVDIDTKLRNNLFALSEASRIALDKVLTQIGRAKTNLESLQGLNTKAKMTNLRLSVEEMNHLDSDLKVAAGAEKLLGLLASKGRELGALERFRSILIDQSDFQTHLQEFEGAINNAYAQPGDDAARQKAEGKLNGVVKKALLSYSDLKERYSLNHTADKRKKQLMEGKQLKQLNRLQNLPVINRVALEGLRQQVAGLLVSKACTDEELLNSPTSLCPYTHFDPRLIPGSLRGRRAEDVLGDCEVGIDQLHVQWTNQLLGELEDPSIKPTLQALKPEERKRVVEFTSSGVLPDDIDAEWQRIIGAALRGLKLKPIRTGDFARATLGDGSPLKVEEVRERFDKWLKEQTAQDSVESVRFVLED